MVSSVDVHPHESVERDAEQLLLLVTHELNNEQRNAKVWQRLPGLDVVHLSLHQRQVLDVGMRLQDTLNQLEQTVHSR